MTKLFLISLCAASLFLSEPLAAASVTLRWTAPGDDGSNGTARQYDIRYSLNPISESNWNAAIQVSGEPAPKVAGTKEAFVVNGLKAGTTYYFAIKAADELPNWSPLSNVLVKSTCTGNCIQFTGNVNGSEDGRVDLADLSLLQAYILNFASAAESICLESANCDGSGDGVVDLSDLVRLVSYLHGVGNLADCP